jgi:LacI family transcriptional regulator
MGKRAKRAPIFEKILKKLQGEISSGVYPFGEFLPPERELADLLKINRQTLRKALHRLAEQGMLKLEPKRGHKVAYEKLRPIVMGKNKIAVIYYRPTSLLQMDTYYGRIFSEIVLQVEQQRDWLTQLLSARRSIESLHDIIKKENIKGFITLGVMKAELIKKLNKFEIPLVSLDFDTESLGIDSVVIDDFEGARQAINLLIQLGHTQIAYMGHARRGVQIEPEEEFSSTLRYKGYLAALKKAGISESYSSLTSTGIEGGIQAFALLKEKYPELTAALTFEDYMAVGVIRAAKSVALKIPEDFSVIGFGDNPHIQEISEKPISTIRAGNFCDIAKSSLDCLFQRLENTSLPVVKKIIKTELIVRGTTAMCPSKIV